MTKASDTTTGASPTTQTNDHTSLSFVRIEHKGPRRQRITHWFAVPDESYCDGNIRGYRVAAEFMAWLQNRPADYLTTLCVRDVISAACDVLAQPHTPNGNDRRGCAVSFLDAMADAIKFAAQHSNHAVCLPSRAQRSETWAKESAERDAERNRQTGQRLAAARKAKREARMAESGVKA